MWFYGIVIFVLSMSSSCGSESAKNPPTPNIDSVVDTDAGEAQDTSKTASSDQMSSEAPVDNEGAEPAEEPTEPETPSQLSCNDMLDQGLLSPQVTPSKPKDAFYSKVDIEVLVSFYAANSQDTCMPESAEIIVFEPWMPGMAHGTIEERQRFTLLAGQGLVFKGTGIYFNMPGGPGEWAIRRLHMTVDGKDYTYKNISLARVK